MKKVIVTGAGGFIGSHLVEELVRRGYDVRAFVRYNGRNSWGHLEMADKQILANVEVLSGDIGDPFFVESALKDIDTVFHLAALIAIPYSYLAPQDFVRTNVFGTLNILEASRKNNVERLVHTSTSEVYGTAQYVPIDEQHPLQAQSPYAATKVSADKLVESYYLTYNLPAVIVRPFNTYGPRQSARAVIPTLISQLLNEGKEVIAGNLDTVRDFNFVLDTVNGFILAGLSAKVNGRVLNLATGTGVRIREILDIAQKIMGLTKTIVIDSKRVRPEKSEVLRLIGNSAFARETLDWMPQFSLEQGIGMTIEYIRSHLDSYKHTTYNI